MRAPPGTHGTHRTHRTPLLLLLALAVGPEAHPFDLDALSAWEAAHDGGAVAERPRPRAPVEAAPPSPAVPGRADEGLDRSWRAPLAGGLLTFPPSFSSEDGTYDLVLHLNGNTMLVEESFGYAGINAAVVILNLGVGSGVYEDRFADPAAFELILSRAQSVMEQRGLRGAKLGRVAVSAWSSGYGGVIKLLGEEAVARRIDAVVLLDSIHCGYESGRLKRYQIEPFERFAERAIEGRALLSITHSEIETVGYLSAHRTTMARTHADDSSSGGLEHWTSDGSTWSRDMSFTVLTTRAALSGPRGSVTIPP